MNSKQAKEYRDFTNLVKSKLTERAPSIQGSIIQEIYQKMITKEELLNLNNQDNVEQDSNKPETVKFGNIDTEGFFTYTSEFDQTKKDELRDAIETVITESNIVAKNVQVTAGSGKVIIQTESILNPGLEGITKVTFDTSAQAPVIEVSGGPLQVTQDLNNFISGVSSFTTGDLKNKLILLTK
jgi:hypothetical protein